MSLLWLLLIPAISTLLGGLLTLALRRYVIVLIALGAGILLGAAFLDLLPEAVALGSSDGLSRASIGALTLLSFVLFYGLDRGFETLGRRSNRDGRVHRVLRRTGVGMLVLHSFRDGMAIGAAFVAAHAAGYAVALGIAAHDIGDGMNTVLLVSGAERPRRSSYLFLAADALAPVLGGLAAASWSMPVRGSVLLLVLAAGFFLQMAITDFLPQAYRARGSWRLLVPSFLLGAGGIYCANLLLEHRR